MAVILQYSGVALTYKISIIINGHNMLQILNNLC